ncbi:MAG: hypothetical protein ACOH2K_17915 [Burkholderiaceae bacterium]
MKKKTIPSPTPEISLTTAYFQYLITPIKGRDSVTRQPAASNFVERLREVHANRNRSPDIPSRLIELSNTGRLYFWSDLHLGHHALAKLRGRSSGETDNMLLANALEIVTEDDCLVFGGDITMTDLSTTNAWLRQIPANKILVLGNHDCDKHAQAVLALAVDDIVSSIELPGIFISHYPVPEKSMDAVRPGEHTINIHGHVHASTLNPDEFGSGGRHANMSVENIGYKPLTLHLLIELTDHNKNA